jgi:hypothetical protein
MTDKPLSRWQKGFNSGVAEERERCAKIAENIISANQYDTMDTDCYQDTANRIADAIRADPPMPYGEAVAYILKQGKRPLYNIPPPEGDGY